MSQHPAFAIHRETRNGIARLIAGGELDMLTTPSLIEALSTAEQEDELSAILMDVRDVTFMDSTGLKAFLDASSRSKSKGHHLLLVGVRPALRRVFEVSGTLDLLDQARAVSIFTEFCRDAVPAIDPQSMMDVVLHD
jgi:anti-sigma B factor antagonist